MTEFVARHTCKCAHSLSFSCILSNDGAIIYFNYLNLQNKNLRAQVKMKDAYSTKNSMWIHTTCCDTCHHTLILHKMIVLVENYDDNKTIHYTTLLLTNLSKINLWFSASLQSGPIMVWNFHVKENYKENCSYQVSYGKN